jgi:CRP/FNR family cyclic AMP-dependent transcriptional regulator
MGRDFTNILLQSFSSLTPEECDELSSYLELQEYSKGSVLMTQGDVGDFMGLVLDGKLAIKKETTFPGKFVLIAILERGALVGEIAMAEETIRTASVVAMEDSSLLVLAHENATKLFRDKPLIGVKMLRRILKVVGGRLQLASARLAQLL